jgi:hypothetical protein
MMRAAPAPRMRIGCCGVPDAPKTGLSTYVPLAARTVTPGRKSGLTLLQVRSGCSAEPVPLSVPLGAM